MDKMRRSEGDTGRSGGDGGTADLTLDNRGRDAYNETKTPFPQ